MSKSICCSSITDVILVLVLFLVSVKDRRELRVHPAEPVLSASSRDVSGAAAGLGRAGRGAVHRLQREGHRELWLLGQEEEEKEEPRSGGPQAQAAQLLAISTT